MFNVLPDSLKKLIRQEYYFRLAIIVALAFIALQVIGLFLLLPSWVLSTYKEQEALSDVAAVHESPMENHLQSVSDTITQTNRTLAVMNTLLYPEAAPLFQDILSRQPAGVHLTGFSYTLADDGTASIVASGNALTRNILVSFEKSLEKSSLFASVNLPVSNLAKDTDIPFSITLSVKKP